MYGGWHGWLFIEPGYEARLHSETKGAWDVLSSLSHHLNFPNL
jgi:hypothetical protein